MSTLSDAQLNELLTLFEQGMPVKEIAPRFGVTPSYVRNLAKTHKRRRNFGQRRSFPITDIEPHELGTAWTAAEVQKMIDMRRVGYLPVEIADYFLVAYNEIQRHLHRYDEDRGYIDLLRRREQKAANRAKRRRNAAARAERRSATYQLAHVLRRQGYTLEQLSVPLGMTVSGVSRLLSRNPFDPSGPMPSQAEIDQAVAKMPPSRKRRRFPSDKHAETVRRLCSQDAPIKEIMQKTGLSNGTINRLIARHGIEYKRPRSIPSDKHLETVRHLLAQDIPITAIAKLVGLNPSTVYVMAKRHGMDYRRKRSLSNVRAEIVRRLRAQGMPIADVAKKTGLNLSTVYTIVRRHGINHSRRRASSDTHAETVRQLWEKGVPVKKIAEEIGFSVSTVYTLVAQYAIKKNRHKE